MTVVERCPLCGGRSVTGYLFLEVAPFCFQKTFILAHTTQNVSIKQKLNRNRDQGHAVRIKLRDLKQLQNGIFIYRIGPLLIDWLLPKVGGGERGKKKGKRKNEQTNKQKNKNMKFTRANWYARQISRSFFITTRSTTNGKSLRQERKDLRYRPASCKE